MEVAAPFVILLNGTSSWGKSTLAAELQLQLADPWFHLGVDDFLKHLPLEEHQDQLVAELKSVMRGIHAAMAALAAAGNRVIIDHVLAQPGWADELRDLLGGTPCLWIGLNCDLDVLEARERGRHREPGTAGGQLGAVHEGIHYDLELDTSCLGPQECAIRVKALLLERAIRS